MRRVLLALLSVLGAVAACSFSPDLSRYAACDAQGGCPSGFTCLNQESRCIPDCEAQATCGEQDPMGGADAGDAGGDSGTEVDAGTDGGTDADSGTDAGTQEPDAGTALALDPDALKPGLEGSAYLGQLRARGGTPPYAFTATETLPSGLTLDGDGQLSGTPAAPGVYYLPIKVTDRSTPPQQASGSIPLRISPTLRMAGPVKLVDADQNRPYTERLYATGGKPPYHFKLAAGGTLPQGVQLADTGEVTGTPSQLGTVDFSVEVTDSDSTPQVATRPLSMRTVNQGGLALVVMTQSVPDARVGSTYSYTLRGFGATPPYTWSWAWVGPAPAGLQLDKAQGLVYGTPTQAGTYTVTFTASDSLLQSADSVQMSLVVVP